MANNLKKIYLVGSCWYSCQQGDMPNSSNFPSFWYESLHDALQKYEELARKDEHSYGEVTEAYLVEMDEVGNKRDIRGRHYL